MSVSDEEQKLTCAKLFVLDSTSVMEDYCPVTWDAILCWPPTPRSTLRSQPCPVEYNEILYDTTQNVTKYCDSNGQWGKANYSLCKELVTDDSQLFIVTTIYYSGYTLSLVALLIAVFIFLCYRELRCLRNTIHTNLMFTYILVGLMWILTITIQVSYEGHIILCAISIVLLQYATLTNFFWMFVEGLYLYMLVVQTFTIETIKLRVYLLIGWGIPIPIILLWSLARTFSDVNVESSNKMMVEHCPWIVSDFSDWIYKFPTLFILAVNCIFLIKIMKVLITKIRSANTVETRQYRKATKALLVLIPLLGITYVLTITLPVEGNTAKYFTFLRDVLLSSQGFIVAVFYCFLNTEVQNTIKHRLDIWSETRNIDVSRRRLTNSKESPYTATESIRSHNTA